MIIYLYGPDSYRRREKVRQYIGEFKKRHSGLSVAVFDLFAEASAKADLVRFKDFVAAQSLFSSVKLGILKNIGTADPKELVLILKNLLDEKSITVIISEDKKLGKDYDFLKKAHTVLEFRELSGAELAAFIKKEAAKRGVKIANTVVTGLISAYGGQAHSGYGLWGIVNDLDKLELGGALEDTIAEPAFFVLINRIKRGDLAALERLLNKQEPAMVFNMIASQAEPSLKTKMADYDVAIKSGKLGYEEALLDLVIK